MQLIENHEFLVPSRPNSGSNNNLHREIAFTLPITSREQRHEYKVEFDRYYNEYQRLHAEMTQERDRFNALQEQLKTLKCHEERKHREIQAQIVREYVENAKSVSFQQKRQRFDFLHEKLSTIKRLVSDFDTLLRSQRR